MSINLPEEKKYPGETIPIGRDFTGALPTGVTLTSCAISSENYYSGTDTTTTMFVSATASVSGAVAEGKARAGTAGDRHLVTYAATLSDGSILQEKFVLIVKREKRS